MELISVSIAAVSGLAGVLLGWLLRRKDQIRQEAREDSYRWHQDRLESYTTYLGAVFQNYFRWTGFTSPKDFKDQIQTLRQRSEEWMQAKAHVDALATPPVLEAADGLADALADVVDHVVEARASPRLRWRRSTEDLDLERSRQGFIEARLEYLNAVRDELGLSTESWSVP